MLCAAGSRSATCYRAPSCSQALPASEDDDCSCLGAGAELREVRGRRLRRMPSLHARRVLHEHTHRGGRQRRPRHRRDEGGPLVDDVGVSRLLHGHPDRRGPRADGLHAWNALLKSLEGGSGVLWILATNYPDKLPVPVRSRSTLLEFLPANANEMRPALEHIRDTEALGTSEAQMQMAIESSGGAMRDAVNALFALDAGLSDLEHVRRRRSTCSRPGGGGNLGASVRLLGQRVKATRDARQVLDEIVEVLMEPLLNGLPDDTSRRLLLARLADQRIGVAAGWLSQMAGAAAAQSHPPRPRECGGIFPSRPGDRVHQPGHPRDDLPDAHRSACRQGRPGIRRRAVRSVDLRVRHPQG